jgi:hypothetical protein
LLLAGAGVVTLVLWRMPSGGVGLIAALSSFSALFSALLFVQLSLRADASGWSERPRTFSLLAAGGPIGAMLGAGAARLVLLVGSPHALMPLSAGLSFTAAILVAGLPANAARAAELSPGNSALVGRDELRSVGKALARDRAVRPLLALVMLTAMAGALADFLFKQRLVSELPFRSIPPLLVTARMGQAVLALVLQIVATRWLLRTSGVVRGLVLLPAGLFLVSQGMSVGAELSICLLARVLEGGLRRSLEVGSAGAILKRDQGARRVLRKALEPATQRLGQTAAMGVIVTTGAAGAAPVWIIAALALASVGWLEWRRAHALEPSPRVPALRAALAPGTLDPRRPPA